MVKHADAEGKGDMGEAGGELKEGEGGSGGVKNTARGETQGTFDGGVALCDD